MRKRRKSWYFVRRKKMIGCCVIITRPFTDPWIAVFSFKIVNLQLIIVNRRTDYTNL